MTQTVRRPKLLIVLGVVLIFTAIALLLFVEPATSNLIPTVLRHLFTVIGGLVFGSGVIALFRARRDASRQGL